jgi:hypothetical protein
MKTFKLPPIEAFATIKKTEDPFLKFFSWVGVQIDPDWKKKGLKMNPGKICLSKEDEQALYKLMLKWGKKHHVSEKQMQWVNVSYGPAVVKKPAGFVYVKAKAFVDEAAD